MDSPQNLFKQALAERRQQIGLWCSIPGGFTTEALAVLGIDWMLLDTEHSPNEVTDVLAQFQALAP